MNIAQELSIVRDNIAEYGMTNITQLEYDAIYQQGKADAIENYIAEQEKFWKENKKVCNTLAKSAKKNGMINMSFFHDGQVSAFDQIIRRLEEQKHKLKEQKQ